MSQDGAGTGRLHVVADLQASVDDQAISVTGDGTQLTVRTADPATLLALVAESEPIGLGSVPFRRLAATAARRLDESGLSLRVVGDRGVVIDLGTGLGSRLGRLLVGSELARLGSPRAVLPIAAGIVRAQVRIEHVAGGVVLAALLIRAGRRRRS